MSPSDASETAAVAQQLLEELQLLIDEVDAEAQAAAAATAAATSIAAGAAAAASAAINIVAASAGVSPRATPAALSPPASPAPRSTSGGTGLYQHKQGSSPPSYPYHDHAHGVVIATPSQSHTQPSDHTSIPKTSTLGFGQYDHKTTAASVREQAQPDMSDVLRLASEAAEHTRQSAISIAVGLNTLQRLSNPQLGDEPGPYHDDMHDSMQHDHTSHQGYSDYQDHAFQHPDAYTDTWGYNQGGYDGAQYNNNGMGYTDGYDRGTCEGYGAAPSGVWDTARVSQGPAPAAGASEQRSPGRPSRRDASPSSWQPPQPSQTSTRSLSESLQSLSAAADRLSAHVQARQGGDYGSRVSPHRGTVAASPQRGSRYGARGHGDTAPLSTRASHMAGASAAPAKASTAARRTVAPSAAARPADAAPDAAGDKASPGLTRPLPSALVPLEQAAGLEDSTSPHSPSAYSNVRGVSPSTHDTSSKHRATQASSTRLSTRLGPSSMFAAPYSAGSGSIAASAASRPRAASPPSMRQLRQQRETLASLTSVAASLRQSGFVGAGVSAQRVSSLRSASTGQGAGREREASLADGFGRGAM